MKNLKTMIACAAVTLLSSNIYAQCPNCNGGGYNPQQDRGYQGNYNNQYENQPSYDQRGNRQSQGYQNNNQNQPSSNQRSNQNYQSQGNQGYDQNVQRQNDRPSNYNNEKVDEQRKADLKTDHANLNPDQVISKKVHDTLTGGWFSKGFQNVSYDVNNGIVTLSGTVESLENKDQVDAGIKKIEGVKQVINNLTLVKANSNRYTDSQLETSEKKYPQDTAAGVDDRQLNARIRDKLSLGWFSKGSEMVILRTQNGIVVISGTVEKPEDVQKVTDQVKAVEGVSSVNNQLQVKPK